MLWDGKDVEVKNVPYVLIEPVRSSLVSQNIHFPVIDIEMWEKKKINFNESCA